MENFKYALFSIVVLALLTFIGYWAFSSIESGSSHLNNQEIKDLSQENKDLKDEVLSLKNEITILESQIKEQIYEVVKEDVVEKTEPTILKYQSNIDALQKLINDKIYMKKGSKGSRVGTVQTFLNIYNKTSTKIDNDYGPGMETLIKKFQADQKITVDGEAGPGTFKKMIEWLKKQ